MVFLADVLSKTFFRKRKRSQTSFVTKDVMSLNRVSILTPRRFLTSLLRQTLADEPPSFTCSRPLTRLGNQKKKGFQGLSWPTHLMTC